MNAIPRSTETGSSCASIKVGDRFEVTIEDVAFGGEGVARREGFVVFVPFVLLNELVEVEVVEVKRRFARARLIQVSRASADRVTPVCPYFAACGGCQYQHASYATQLQMKFKQVSSIMGRIARLSDPPIDAVIPCPRPYNYRNRIMVRSHWNRPKQGLDIGFLRCDSRLVEDIESCSIAEPALNEKLSEVRRHPPPKGGLKVELRVMPDNWELPRDSFFQNNFYLLPELVATVRRKLESSAARYLIDAYCGVGFFSVELADLVDRFVGVESDPRAVAAARRNAAARGRFNGDYIEGRTEDCLESVMQQFPAAETALILDPPRRGCLASTLDFIGQTRPLQVLYISCHPATLARDLRILTEQAGYRLERVTPLDLFPQTQHVECVTDLRLRKSQ